MMRFSYVTQSHRAHGDLRGSERPQALALRAARQSHRGHPESIEIVKIITKRSLRVSVCAVRSTKAPCLSLISKKKSLCALCLCVLKNNT